MGLHSCRALLLSFSIYNLTGFLAWLSFFFGIKSEILLTPTIKKMDAASPILSDTETLKTTKYRPLLLVAEAQALRGARNTAPLFKVAAVSGEGVLSRSMTELKDSMIKCFLNRTRDLDGDYDIWGADLVARTNAFRNQLSRSQAP